MNKLSLRKATADDMEEILRLQVETFHGEQKIPSEGIPLPDEKSPQWWCAVLDDVLVGAVAAWEEDKQVHWGRFVTDPTHRGLQIGTKLARFSLDDLFSSQQVDEIHMEAREITVKMICRMGGKIIGEPIPFFEGTVTPLVLKKVDYLH
ncbi:GNAT family N-acetyltransferase [Trichococcus ilyis]|jgi:predicted GNAT family N-acyltransferase|uniref:Acyl-coa n-acyltransferase n=1 Tax=Trichococcus ilyis TaxID=640938 RepID=A0A143YLL1_9LACT|nr:GNAT family N-acetyltransferase [Trichococcus ilyis]CZQ91538.1 acyl-coa n-acyltransferase [Trichococcus ilyis]SEI75484.1 Predicted N-acyltransferase, GNAT family [Trichococcus ilyis]